MFGYLFQKLGKILVKFLVTLIQNMYLPVAKLTPVACALNFLKAVIKVS